MSSVSSNGITVEYEVQGAGEPLLLVMGLGGQLIAWPQNFIEQLVSRGFKVITFDNRDSGLSTKGVSAPQPMWRQLLGTISRRFVSTEYLLSDMADDAVGLLDALGIESAHVVGISMGAMVAQLIAIGYLTRVRSLTSIMSTTGDRRVGRVAPKLLVRLPKLLKGGADSAVARSVELLRLVSGSSFDEAEARDLLEIALHRSYCPDGTARQTAAIMASPDRTDALQALSAPALVVHGLEDTLVQPSGGLATTRAIPGARLLMFPDMGHNLPKPRHAEIAEAIADLALRRPAMIGQIAASQPAISV